MRKEKNLIKFSNFLKEFRNEKSNQRGITLIALVITIIILLILAGVTLNVAISQNGLFQRANKSKAEYVHSEVKEAMELAHTDYVMEKEEKENNNKSATLIEFLQKREIIGDGEGTGKYKINLEKLLGGRQAIGNGTGEKDVYMLEEESNEKTYKLMYYGNDESENRELNILNDTITNTRKIITFYVSNGSSKLVCKCESGMTWFEFIDSDYYVDKIKWEDGREDELPTFSISFQYQGPMVNGYGIQHKEDESDVSYFEKIVDGAEFFWKSTY